MFLLIAVLLWTLVAILVAVGIVGLLLPALPGLPVGSRSSIILCSANNDRFELDAARLDQSNHCVATCDSRWVKPLSLAAARILSSASATRRCSSPDTR